MNTLTERLNSTTSFEDVPAHATEIIISIDISPAYILRKYCLENEIDLTEVSDADWDSSCMHIEDLLIANAMQDSIRFWID